MLNTQMKFGLCAAFAIFLSLLGAVSFEEYPLGCYTLMSNRESGNAYTEIERAQILELISGMGYNVAQIDNRDGDYTYTDGAPVSALSSFYPNGFTPNTTATTDASGVWSGQIWVATEEGEYDIIVDIGSPTTPDGLIHYAFSGADVMDGFDGRTEPGFMVKDINIDVVMAMVVLAAQSKALQSKK
ncbi:MAG: hypothetical protein PHY48_00110 [Candidatus Cloacimonetes bacterium]|nr:hypothetical protein [Candidatus Cloacimonadota bacterium]